MAMSTPAKRHGISDLGLAKSAGGSRFPFLVAVTGPGWPRRRSDSSTPADQLALVREAAPSPGAAVARTYRERRGAGG